MTRLTLLIALLLSMAFSVQGQDSVEAPSAKNIHQLEWLLHSWQRTNVRPGSKAFEKWEKVSNSKFEGLGWTMKGSDTTFVEKLRIEAKEGKLYYVADVPDNPAPTYFLITEITEEGFVSENPKHDFPKMINYQMKEEELVVIISDGADKKMGFIFERK